MRLRGKRSSELLDRTPVGLGETAARRSFFFARRGSRNDIWRTSDIVQVFGRRDDDTIHALLRSASKKRQSTKSREVGHRRCRGRYGDFAAVTRAFLVLTLPTTSTSATSNSGSS